MTTPGIAVRACQPDECPRVLALWRDAQATPSPTDSLAALERLLTQPQARLLVAVLNGRIVGSVIAAWDGWRGNIYRLAVAPAQRRQGIARALMREADAFLHEQGASRVRTIRYVGTLAPRP